jgi:molecular chaperone HscB
MIEAVIETKQTPEGLCPHCGAKSGGAHFCSRCEKILPVARTTDYFAFFGRPRKLRINEPDLERDFYSLSRLFHPDYFMNSSDLERSASMERSSMLNDAYRTLRNPIARVTYLLALEGYNEAEKKAPPDLLEEVFELNMQLEELRMAKKTDDEEEIATARASLEDALASLHEELNELDRRLFELFDGWDSSLDSAALGKNKKDLLDRMSGLLSHRSYIRNLVRDIKEEL